MSVAFPPSVARTYAPVATRRSWTVGYTVETMELGGGHDDGGWARDAAQDAPRLDAPRTGGQDFSRALRVAPPLEYHTRYDPNAWHQPGMPLPTATFLAMRDATRHLR